MEKVWPGAPLQQRIHKESNSGDTETRHDHGGHVIRRSMAVQIQRASHGDEARENKTSSSLHTGTRVCSCGITLQAIPPTVRIRGVVVDVVKEAHRKHGHEYVLDAVVYIGYVHLQWVMED